MRRKALKSTGIIILRFISYIAGKVLAVILSVYFIWLCMMTAMNTVNANVVVKDAITKQATITLDPTEEKEKELIVKICTEDYILSSGILNENRNKPYEITSYHQRVDVPYSIILPWVDEMKYTVSSQIKDVVIDYSESFDARDDAPFFPSGIYEVTVIKNEGNKWYISSIELIESVYTEYELPELDLTVEYSEEDEAA